MSINQVLSNNALAEIALLIVSFMLGYLCMAGLRRARHSHDGLSDYAGQPLSKHSSCLKTKADALLSGLPRKYLDKIGDDAEIAMFAAMVRARVRYYIDSNNLAISDAEMASFIISSKMAAEFINDDRNISSPEEWDSAIAELVESYQDALHKKEGDTK